MTKQSQKSKITLSDIIMLSAIFFLYTCIRYTTLLAYNTDISVISLFHVYTLPQRGIEPGGFWLQVGSDTHWAMQALEH